MERGKCRLGVESGQRSLLATLSDKIQETLVDDVVNHGFILRETGQRVLISQMEKRFCAVDCRFSKKSEPSFYRLLKGKEEHTKG